VQWMVTGATGGKYGIKEIGVISWLYWNLEIVCFECIIVGE